MKITNNSQATQGVHSIKGPVYIKAGQTADVELSDDGLRRARRLSFLTVEAGDVPSHGEELGRQLADDERDENGDTAEGAAMRQQFNASWEAARRKAGAVGDETLSDAIQRLVDNAESAKTFEVSLRTALGLKDGEGIIEAIGDLRKQLTDAQANAPAKTAAQVLAMFDDQNVHFQTAKSEALKLLGADAPQSQTKDDLVAALKAKAA